MLGFNNLSEKIDTPGFNPENWNWSLLDLLESEQGCDVPVGRDPPEQVVVGHVDRPVGGGGDRLGRQQPLSQGGPVAPAAGAVDGPLLPVAHNSRHDLVREM